MAPGEKVSTLGGSPHRHPQRIANNKGCMSAASVPGWHSCSAVTVSAQEAQYAYAACLCPSWRQAKATHAQWQVGSPLALRRRSP